jgi:acetoin utilization deacetylase AcuC-like enzyme
MKYRMVVERLAKEEVIKVSDLFMAPLAADDELLLAHTREYVDRVKALSLSFNELLALEMPLSREIVDSYAIACGGTAAAAELAFGRDPGIHIGGGFHNAFAGRGERFCLFNDVAVAVLKLKKEGKAKRVLIIDCGLHRGNGTAEIFRDDPDVFSFSMHEAGIIPPGDEMNTLDIVLPRFSGNDEYLGKLRENLPALIKKINPEFVMYLAGADAFEGDQLGHLKVTIEGLADRDRFIYEQTRGNNIPAAVLLGGGYSLDRRDTVKIHSNTVKIFMGKNI